MGRFDEWLRRTFYRRRYGTQEGDSRYELDAKLRAANEQIEAYGGDSLHYWVSTLPEEAREVGAQLAGERAQLLLDRGRAVKQITQTNRLKGITEELMLHRRKLAAQLLSAEGDKRQELERSVSYLDGQIAERIAELGQAKATLEKMKEEVRRGEELYKARMTTFCLHFNIRAKPGEVTP